MGWLPPERGVRVCIRWHDHMVSWMTKLRAVSLTMALTPFAEEQELGSRVALSFEKDKIE